MTLKLLLPNNPVQGKAQPPEPLGERRADITPERLKQMLKEGAHNDIIRMRKPPITVLIGALGDENEDIAQDVSRLLSEMVERKKKFDWSVHIDKLAEAMGGNGMGHVYAAAIVAKIAFKHPEYDWSPVVPLMIEDVRNGGAGDRTRAINALGNMEEVSAVPAIVEALEKEIGSGPLGAAVRVEAVKALAKIAERHPECNFVDAIPAILDALVDENLDVRGHAGALMKRMAERHPKEVASKIIELVNGRLGDELKEVNSRNGALAAVINKILLKCGKAMEDAA
ncbi:HEAT repeat domain-containing protein [Candidatus Micrarchaeota archaeon]|nr:HEAT repeat domain-containing protein [Candidatus Micrarchaeota archaeon]